MKIVLIGFRGAGKTSVGRALAGAFDLPLIDTDEEIERREGRSISQIFKDEGEAYFRKVEREVILGLRQANGVIATGGGAAVDPENVKHLRAGGDVFLLAASERTILERTASSHRPPLTPLPREEEVKMLLERRRVPYLMAADFCIDTDTATIGEISSKIARIITEGPVKREERTRALQYRGFSCLSEEERDALERALLSPPRPTHRICAIAGYPVKHSLSPRLYNRLFALYSLNYHYTRMEDPEIESIIDFFRRMEMRGLSITIPHKVAVIEHLDEVQRDAEQIGAVNTVVQCGDRAYGFNTDWIGVREPLRETNSGLAAVIGAGGAAAAAAYALLSLGMEVHILNRTREKAATLAKRLGAEAGVPSDLGAIRADLVVNATPVGMNGEDRLPVNMEHIRQDMIVFDLVYTPPETALIKSALAKGCRVITGVEMFVHQAVAQFRLITGIEVTPDTVRRCIA